VRRMHTLGVAALCAIVAGLAGIAAALGVFARGDGAFQTVTSVRGVTYEMATSGVYAYNSQRVVAEGVGWDVFTLFVAVPAMLVALPFVARGSFRGRLFAIGLLGYFFYQYIEYSVTWAFGPLFLLFIAIYAASIAGIAWLGVLLARTDIDRHADGRFPGRAFAVVSATLAVLLSMSWFQRIALGLGGDLEAAGLRGETTMVVQALDLGLVVPATLFVAAMAWRRTPAGQVLAAVFAVTAVAMATAIVAMLISAGMVEGAFELPPLVIFGGFVATIGYLGFQTYQMLGRGERPQVAPHPGRTAVASRAA